MLSLSFCILQVAFILCYHIISDYFCTLHDTIYSLSPVTSTPRSSAVAVSDKVRPIAATEVLRPTAPSPSSSSSSIPSSSPSSSSTPPTKRIAKRAVETDDYDDDADVHIGSTSKSPSHSSKVDKSQSGKRHKQTPSSSYRDDRNRKNGDVTSDNSGERVKEKSNKKPVYKPPTMHYSDFPPLEVIIDDSGLPAAPKKRVKINLESIMVTRIPNRDDIKEANKEYELRKKAMGGISDDVDWAKANAPPSPTFEESVEDEYSDSISYHASSSLEDVRVSVPPTPQSEDGPMSIDDWDSVETVPLQDTIHPSTPLYLNTAPYDFNADPPTTPIPSTPTDPSTPLHFPPSTPSLFDAPQTPQLSLASLRILSPSNPPSPPRAPKPPPFPQPPLFVQFAPLPPPLPPALYRNTPPPPAPELPPRPYFVTKKQDSVLYYAPANMTPHEHQQQLKNMEQQSLSRAQENIMLNVQPTTQAAYSGGDQNVRPVVTAATLVLAPALSFPMAPMPIQPPPSMKTESPREVDRTPHPPLIKSEPVAVPKPTTPAPPVAEPTRKITKPSFYIARFDVPKDRYDLP